MSDAAQRGVVLGVDVGTVRVGIAASDETRTLASPVATLQRRDARLWQHIGDACTQRHVTLIVVGLPRRLDGSEGDNAADARAFAADVTARTGITVTLWDERFTTALAERQLIVAGMRRRRRRATVDAAAAVVLLQGWLDAQLARV